MSNIVDPKSLAQNFWGGMDKKDFSVPRVSLAQPTSQKGELAGKFVYNTGASVDVLAGCKLIVPTKTRVLYSGGGRARCSSDNFYDPSPRIKSPISSSCLVCPVGAWGEDPLKDTIAREVKPKNYDPNKPLCNETYNLLMADKDWNLFFINFQKTQLAVVSKSLFTRLRYNFGSVAPYEVSFDIKSFKAGSYYNVEFENFVVLGDDDKARAADIYSQWSSRAKDELAKQHEEMDNSKEEIPF